MKKKTLKKVETNTQNNECYIIKAASISNKLYLLLFNKDDENNEKLLFIK